MVRSRAGTALWLLAAAVMLHWGGIAQGLAGQHRGPAAGAAAGLALGDRSLPLLETRELTRAVLLEARHAKIRLVLDRSSNGSDALIPDLRPVAHAAGQSVSALPHAVLARARSLGRYDARAPPGLIG